MAKKSKVTYESQVEKAILKVQAKPWKALNIIGAFLTKQIKAQTLKAKTPFTIVKKDGSKAEVQPGTLAKGNKYKTVKKENKLLVGNIQFWSRFIELGTSKQGKRPFFANTIQANMDTIQKLVAATYQELNNENTDDAAEEYKPPANEDNIGGS